MTKETLMEVVSELIGYTEPYGDSNKDKLEYSMAQIGGRAYETLEKLHKIIEENL